MNLQILLTGNEVMSGDIVDSNSAMVAQALSLNGWSITKKVTVADDLAMLVDAIRDMSLTADVLLINGGLGPTVDDLTAKAMAVAADVELKLHDEAHTQLDAWCQRRGFAMNEANRKQAILPAGCEVIPNLRGSAPGIALTLGHCELLATPGVPGELRAMLDDAIIPRLMQRFTSDQIEVRRLVAFGIGESTLQEQIDERWPDWPEDIDLGFRASMPTVEVKLTGHGCAAGQLDLWEQKLRDYLGDAYLGMAPYSLAESVIDACVQNHLTTATAESCTGGRIAAALTGVAGSSSAFVGGIVSYSNSMKQAVLGVEAETLDTEGAVSEAVARAMLSGALNTTGADLAIAVTGIAGPDGGSPDKPVGTVWIAWGGADSAQCVQLCLSMDRAAFQTWTTALCLDLLRRSALGIDSLPGFITRYRRV